MTKTEHRANPGPQTPLVGRGQPLLTAGRLGLWLAVTGFVAFFEAAPTQALDTAVDWADSLQTSTEAARKASDYAAAAHTAQDFVDWLRSQPEAQPWQLREPSLLLETYETIAALSPEAQRELARADALSDDVNVKEQEGDYPGAVDLLRRQLEIRQRLLGANAYLTSLSLNDLGFFLVAIGELDEAEERFRSALEIDRQLLVESPSLATSEANVAMVLQEKGDFADAEPHLVSTLHTYRLLLGDRDPRVALALNNLAINLAQRGELASAEPLLRKALAIRLQVLEPDAPDIGVSLYNLASILKRMGNLVEAERYYKQGVDAAIAAYGEDHPEVALAMSNYGTLLVERGDYAEAETVLRQSYRIQVAHLGEDDPTAAHILNNLGAALRGLNRLEESEAASRRALAALLEKVGPVHPMVADVWMNLGRCLSQSGRHAAAKVAYEEALHVRQACNGRDHPSVVRIRTALAHELACLGDEVTMRSQLEAAVRSYEVARLRVGRDFDRAAFELNPYTALAAVRVEVGETEPGWSAAESGRARVLADLLLSTGSAPRTAAERMREERLRDDLATCEERVAAMRRAARGSSSSSTADPRFDDAERRLLDHEATLGSFEDSIAARYGPRAGRPFGLERVQASLDPDEALVGWVEATDCERPRAWAYVLRNRGAVTWIALAGDDSSKSAINEFRRALGRPPSPFGNGTMETLARRAHALWFEPLESALGGARSLVVIPSGNLLGAPIEALRDSTGMYIGDRYSVSYAPSATIYSWLREQQRKQDSGAKRLALFLADPPMNISQQETMIREGSRERAATSQRPSWQAQPAFVQCLRSGNADSIAALPRLRASRSEVLNVSRLFQGRCRLLLGPAASEAALAGMADSLRLFEVVHLATHAIIDDRDAGNSALIVSQVGLPDPLEAVTSNRPAYDGRITAREILRRWKLDADLVVLSGCATGLGQHVAEEGYLGFAHVLFEAGARNLLLSLWEVDDESTAMLMERFYFHWGELESRGSERAMAEALQRARQDLRAAGRSSGRHPYEHPWYWSGFVLVGPGS